jgi:hypothetical protein
VLGWCALRVLGYSQVMQQDKDRVIVGKEQNRKGHHATSHCQGTGEYSLYPQ